MVLKKALYNADLFIDDNSKPTHRDGRTNRSDIIDYIISSPAIFNKIQNLTLNNDLSSDHSAILFNFSTNLNKSILPSIKVKLYHKTDRDSINSSLSKHLTILQEQILNLLSSENADPINIINNTATILSDTFTTFITISRKKLLNQILVFLFPFNYSLNKIKRAFIQTRNPFIKSALNATTKKIKKLIKNHRTTD